MADLGAWSQINCFENWSGIFKREIFKRAEEIMFAAFRHKFVCLIRKNFRSLMTYGQSEHSKICDCNFFTLEDSRRPAGRNQADFFLEADRTTETWPKQFQNKVRTYWCYLQDGPHEKQFNEEKITITNFRVLTLTIIHKRAEILSDKTHKLVPEGRKHN